MELNILLNNKISIARIAQKQYEHKEKFANFYAWLCVLYEVSVYMYVYL